jgi:hypothetical protein
MPTESILVSIGVCAVFLVFAFVLAWADHTTSQWIFNKVNAKQEPEPAQKPDREAA